ncbi:ribonuclease [Pseudoduganella eburnea]|uniref:Ribonuclease n=1 Tax=Massilia eburnea TaxID=1776165 RepID=A0A6L6QGA5_9BURK|nr:ribonuclease [Massilia eburnea]MTW11249.1 ribonuclease [Massilia eburnea]
MKKLHAALAALAVAASTLLGAAPAQARDDRPGVFDYYTMSLSWSPEFCAGRGGGDPVQCATGRQLGFVLHGLWPQFERGYPESCGRSRISNKLRDQYESLYPSPKLLFHEWNKHGSCSGLQPQDYLALSAKLRDSLKIPAAFARPQQPVRVTPGQFEDEFHKANPWLAKDSVLPVCGSGGRFLREARVCFAKDGKSRSCSQEAIAYSQKSCGQANFLMKNVR